MIDYYSTELLGSVRFSTGSSGSVKSSYTYDAYGALLEGELSGASNYGYLGKQKDPTTNFYNYGYRDYKPATARFTTIDPIRDGSNWFTYCNGDPVNFVDLLGLETSDKKVILNKQEKNTLDAGLLILPIEEGKFTVTDSFGKRTPVVIDGKKGKDFHNGTDFAALKGVPIRAVASGEVKDKGYNSIFGNYLEIRHSETTTTFYAHMDSVKVNKGDYVKGGETIGTVGSTGFSTGPHLHYELRINGKPTDPHF